MTKEIITRNAYVKKLERLILSGVIPYEELFIRINEKAENDSISAATQLKADSMLQNEYQFIRTHEIKAPTIEEDLHDLSDEELDSLLLECKDDDPNVIDVEIE